MRRIDHPTNQRIVQLINQTIAKPMKLSPVLVLTFKHYQFASFTCSDHYAGLAWWLIESWDNQSSSWFMTSLPGQHLYSVKWWSTGDCSFDNSLLIVSWQIGWLIIMIGEIIYYLIEWPSLISNGKVASEYYLSLYCDPHVFLLFDIFVRLSSIWYQISSSMSWLTHQSETRAMIVYRWLVSSVKCCWTGCQKTILFLVKCYL